MSAETDFDSWMDTEAKPRNGAKGRVWDRWPDEVKSEIERACKRNDARPERRIPIPSLLARWKAEYGVSISKDALLRYCQSVLGRRSFTQAA